MKERLKSLKEYFGKFSKKTIITAAVVAVIIILGAIAIAFFLNRKDYVTLFTGVTEEETTEILAQLSEMDVEYISDGAGNIRVPSDQVDTTRAQLAQEGYPKSGFTYDVFTTNAGGMTTDMEKQTYKLYDLQNRIGATIRLFDGVEDAKVTIALEEEDQYVLNDSDEEGGAASSASVVVVMKDGGSPTSKQAAGIQRLVARSVPDMEMENVSVLDGSGIEVSSSSDSGASSDAAQEVAQIIENQVAKKVINVLEPFYGADNIRVSAKGQVNMEKLIREETTYSTPEKIDENDKTGIVSEETTSVEASGSGVEAAGVVGTETNSEISQYVADSDGDNDGYISQSETRDYLVNMIKEQGEIAPGVLEDLTVSVAINGESLGGLTQNRLLDLVGNATGIDANDRRDKITIVNAPFYEEEGPEEEELTAFERIIQDYLPFIIVGIALLLVLLTLLFVLLGKKKKKKKKEEEEFLEELPPELPPAEEEEGQEEPEEENIINIQDERSRELRESVREFADENPELSAQMIKNWLHGGDDNGN